MLLNWHLLHGMCNAFASVNCFGLAYFYYFILLIEISLNFWEIDTYIFIQFAFSFLISNISGHEVYIYAYTYLIIKSVPTENEFNFKIYSKDILVVVQYIVQKCIVQCNVSEIYTMHFRKIN